jgi:RNA polymerase sigma-70 factor, ECF subfamily
VADDEGPPVAGEVGAWLAAREAALLVYARHWARSEADAGDVVQEGVVRFLGARARAADPEAYLYACVRSAALDWLRRNSRRVRHEEAAARERPAADSAFESPIERAEEARAAEAAGAALPEHQREAVLLKIWGGLTFSQIGTVQGVPLDTAASRYRTAMESLRSTLMRETQP